MSLCFGACGRSTETSQVLIAAAASLTNPLSEIGEAFTLETGIDVTFTFASTGHLAQQIRNDAPYDFFAAADSFHIDALIEEGKIKAQTRTHFAQGSIVLIIDPKVAVSTDSPELLKGSDITRLVIANPNHAPYGIAAKQFLQNANLWDQIQGRLVFSENVRQAAQVVFTGNATAGIIAKSISLTHPTHTIPIDPASHDPILHFAGVTENSHHPEEAITFLNYLSSPASAQIFRAHGLTPQGSD